MTRFECKGDGSAVQHQPGSEMSKFTRQSPLIWHNKVRDNWIQFCNVAYIGTYNKRVNFRLKILKHCGKIVKKP